MIALFVVSPSEERGRNACNLGKQSCEVGVIVKAQTMRNLLDGGCRIDQLPLCLQNNLILDMATHACPQNSIYRFIQVDNRYIQTFGIERRSLVRSDIAF